MQTLQLQNPYLSFGDWLKRRKELESKHSRGNGINDYAYGIDLELRDKLNKIPGFYKNSRRLVETVSAREMAELNKTALQVTPNIHGDIYKMTADCAARLGIAMPYVYLRDYLIRSDAQGNPIPEYGMNACTFGTDDHQQVIIITSALVRRATPGELKTVIGHECGHIHNRHTTYYLLVQLLGSLSASVTTGFLTAGIQMMLAAWSRAAEVTADRAAILCADRPEDAMMFEFKSLNGGLESQTGFSMEDMNRQLERMDASFLRFSETMADHPYPARRVMAMKAFTESELFAEWRPDLISTDRLLVPHEEVERRCREILDFVRM